MGEHTKTPWRVIHSHEIDDDGKIVNTVYGIAAGKMEGPFENTGYRNPEDAVYYRHEHEVVEIGCDRDYHYPEAAIADKDDAEFICLAVNNHDALVTALKNAIAECCEHNAEYHHRTSEADLNDWRELVKSASPGRDRQGGKVEG